MTAPVLSRIGGTRAGVWVIGNLISPLQRRVIRITGGRVTLTRKPVLLLTAVGRRSGRSRTVPLFYLRDGDNLIVCNVRPPGERRNPWPLNVRADPEVTICISGVAEPRIARDARPEEIDRLWPRLVALWPPTSACSRERTTARSSSSRSQRRSRLDPTRSGLSSSMPVRRLVGFRCAGLEVDARAYTKATVRLRE
jgi:deazaflavin-dependent oxidoreductase (nitroreductase family)